MSAFLSSPLRGLARGPGRGRAQRLRQLDGPWPRAACRLLESEPVVIRVLVAQMRGSAPREPGACMLVTGDATEGTIGGGNLEWQAIQAARELLTDASAPAVRLRRLVLGIELGQCCGGVVQLWLERLTRADLPLLRHADRASGDGVATLIVTEVRGASVVRRLCRADAGVLAEKERAMLAANERRKVVLLQRADHDATLLERVDEVAQPLWIYGAGHVGQALIHALTGLPFRVTWVDSRTEMLPEDLPDNVQARRSPAPTDTVRDAPAGAAFLVLTHDHALDYALCHAILERGDFCWLGLIGSSSKSARFRSRLARDGVAADRIARLVCPIGVAGIDSKLPAAIAIGVAAQLLQRLGSTRATQDEDKTAAIGHDCCNQNCASCPSQRRDRA
jgi:xanthine dehydrogenase accessory factor